MTGRVAIVSGALVASALSVGAQRAPAPAERPLLVQGAMTIEVQLLASRLQGAREERVGGWTFWRGTVDGHPVVVERTQKGVANAAAATALAVDRYRPAAIINQGTAGGHDPALHVGDIVIGTTAVSLGAFRTPFRESGRGTNPLEWRPIDLTAADGSAANDPNARRIARFDADARLLATARATTPSYTRGRVVEGTIGTSDMWNDELDLVARFHNEYGTSVEEMETASAAQVAKQLQVPFLGIRIVSDNITNGGAYDPNTAEACDDYVYQVIKAYVGVRAQGGTAAAADLPAVDAAAMLKTAKPDLAKRIARFKPVRMPFDASTLDANERQMVEQLVAASRALESMYWRQSDPVGLALYKALASDGSPLARDVRHYLFINGSRWDLVRENEPFVGAEKMPAGHYLYPTDLTRAAIDAYVAAHPADKAPIFDPFRVVARGGAALTTRPYHDAFAPFIAQAADALNKAAALSPDAAFANFLRLRARSLQTDDYYASDVAWVDLKNPKVDVIFAPYETYLDDLLGVKTSYGAAVMIRNEPESRNLELYQRWVPDIQDALPLAPEDRPSVRGHATPMEVMDTPFRAGDLRHGYQAVADNLPNDPRIHQEKGTKKIFFKNFMDARVGEVILPLAAAVMDPAQAKQASAEGYLASTVLHEICHGLGPAFARRAGRRIDIREAMAGAFSGLEEAKADVVGMFALKWLTDRGVLKKARLEEYYASYVAGIFRTVRFGTGEAHGRAEMMEFNYLASQGAIVRKGGRYAVEYAKMPAAIARLAQELLEQEATGDRARTEAWFAKYDVVPPELRQALDAARDVPIDVDPIVSFDETVR